MQHQRYVRCHRETFTPNELDEVGYDFLCYDPNGLLVARMRTIPWLLTRLGLRGRPWLMW